MSIREDQVNDSMESAVQFCLDRIVSGASDQDIVQELAQETGLAVDELLPLVQCARQSFDEKLNAQIRTGIERAFVNRQPSRGSRYFRLIVRLALLLTGLFFCLAALGGYGAGEPAAATLVLLMGFAAISSFLLLRQRA